MEFSLENMCRTCMNDEGVMCSVFSTEHQSDQMRNQSFADMLMACATVQISAEDGLPVLICQQCMKQLLIAYNFKEQCERSDATLREITKNPTIEFIKEEVCEDTYSDIDNILQVEIRNDFNSRLGPYSRDLQEPEHINIKEDFELTEEYLEDNILVEDEEAFNVKSESDESFTFEKLKLPPKRRNITTKCSVCQQRFKSPMELRRHKKVHNKIYNCELCGKIFRSSHGLGYHLKIHKGIKNYVCHFANCERRFTLKQALEKHISVHTQEKNHLCSLCGKTYSTYDALHYHIKTHEGERPHLCMYCGKTFKQACHLKSHMWIHNGIKPHVCKTCGKCYTSGHQLKKHLKKYCNAVGKPVEIAVEIVEAADAVESIS